MLTHTSLAGGLARVTITIARQDQRRDDEGKRGEAEDLQVASRFALAAVQTGARDALGDVIGPLMQRGRGQ